MRDRPANQDVASPTPASPAAPRAVVEAFLRALEARDLPTATALLRPGAAMTFPGGKVFHRLEDLVAWSATRYRFVRKTFERFDELATDDGRTIVYSLGTLQGEWPDGTAFADIRYIDRFEVEGGLIVDQQVWNDLAAALSLRAPPG